MDSYNGMNGFTSYKKLYFNLDNKKSSDNQFRLINSNLTILSSYASSLLSPNYFLKFYKGWFQLENTIMENFLLWMDIHKANIVFFQT